MQVICPAVSLFDQIVGKQRCVEANAWRLMTYVIQYPVSDGVLLYHTLTCCLLLLTHEEAAYLELMPRIFNWWWDSKHEDERHQIRNRLIKTVEMWCLECRPDEEAALLCCRTVSPKQQ